MKTVTVQNFHGGIADDIYENVVGQFAIAKHFDILTYPKRLQPLRGMMSDTPGTAIGNIILASDGLLYGLGIEPGFSSTTLFKRTGYGASDVWASLEWDGSGTPSYNFLVEFTNAHINNRQFYWGTSGGIYASGASGISSLMALSFIHLGQGFVHPKDQILYVPYDNNIGTITNAAETINTAQFVLPSQYIIPCLTNYGNYLAIPAYVSSGVTNNSSIVYLSDRDTSLTTFAESINWGAGKLKVLNNLDGVLIGISEVSSFDGSQNQDVASIVIKGYNGGTDPFLIKEIKANHLFGASHPEATINQRVNFVYKNRLYFSININPNDGIQSAYYGLWSIGKNKVNGQYSVTMERVATNDNSELGIIAAAFNGDFVSMCHTTEGTLTCTINGQSSATTYAATSVYESVINPNMPEIDQIYKKTLMAVGIQTAPLQIGQQVVMKYRADSTGAWTPLFTKTSTSPDTDVATYEHSLSGSGGSLIGRNLEFRLESTGGAIITGYSYKYQFLKSNL